MVLIKSTPEGFEVLLEGSLKTLLPELDRLTIESENNGFMLVEKLEEGNTYENSFATQSNGYSHSLIICGGVAHNVTFLDTVE